MLERLLSEKRLLVFNYLLYGSYHGSILSYILFINSASNLTVMNKNDVALR